MGRRGILAFLSGLLFWPRPAEAYSLAQQRRLNDEVRAISMKEGDDGSVPRQVDHWAYPKRGGIPQKDMVTALQVKGFEAEPIVEKGGIRFGHVVAIAGVEFDMLTLMLAEYCEEKRWTYDGWESVVVRKEPGP